MDKVRFGRALGYGARHAAKAVAQAVEAATTPDPAAKTTPREESPQAKPVDFEGVRRGVRQTQQAGRSFFGPLAKFSKALWLEVTGSFFLLVALFLGSATWKQRAAILLPPATHEAQKLYVCLVMFVAFAYFAASSFVRAGRVNRAGR